MNAPRITLLGSHHKALTEYLTSHPEGHERAAIILFHRLHVCIEGLPNSDRYIAQDVIYFDENWINSSSPLHFDFNLSPLRDFFRRCEEQNLVFGFVHNHPGGQTMFSSQDDENENTLLTALKNRNGKDISFVAMLWVGDRWHARVRSGASPNVAIPARHILVTSNPLQIFGYQGSGEDHAQVHARGAAAFGSAFVDKINSLRVGIVGVGGTGSPLATLGTRAGIGELVLIDDDELASSNLNRVRGLGKKHVGGKKAKNLKEFIDGLELSTNVGVFVSKIDEDPLALDALATCDVVFGCTDDFVGRDVMNIALYTYAQIYIDLGLGGRILDDEHGQPVLRYHFGRISTIFPEEGQCLYCQGVVSDIWIQTQLERRQNPDISDEELKEKYLEDGGEEAPGVGPFTSAIADYGLATLFDLIKPFRRYPPEIRRDMFNVDFVKMEISSHKTGQNPECPYCEKHVFLLMREQYRLQRPMLGKRKIYV